MSDKPKSKLFDDSDEDGDDYKPSDTAPSTQPPAQSDTANELANDNNEEYVPGGGAGMEDVNLGGLGNTDE